MSGKNLDGIDEGQFRDQHSEKSNELRAQLKEQKRLLGLYKKEHGKISVFMQEVINTVPIIDPAPVIYSPSNSEKKVSSPCTFVGHVTDVHLGAVQLPNEIEGFGEFNPEICEQRQMSFVNKTIDWLGMHRYGYHVPEGHIIVTGDLISGDIHDELKITNAYPSPVQCVESGLLLAKQIASWAPHFDKLIVHFLVADNHSRLTDRPQSKEEGLNSFNYIVGKFAEQAVSRHSNVDFRIYPQYEKVIDVANLRYLIMHGHNLRGWMGIPWYSFERHVGKEASARMSQIMDAGDDLMTVAKKIGFHKMLTGHFHTPFDHPMYACGGSVSGTDAYDHKSGRHAKPCQVAWFNHPKNGEFDRTPFQL